MNFRSPVGVRAVGGEMRGELIFVVHFCEGGAIGGDGGWVAHGSSDESGEGRVTFLKGRGERFRGGEVGNGDLCEEMR